MPTIEVEGKEVEIDEEGFLVNYNDWTQEVAEALAKADGCTLTAPHWFAIIFLFAYYDKHQIAPTTRDFCEVMEKFLGTEKGDLEHLKGLFKNENPLKQACRYTGLPRISFFVY